MLNMAIVIGIGVALSLLFGRVPIGVKIGRASVIGALFCAAELHYAYGMDTTVLTDSGDLVHNIGLISTQHNLIMISGFFGLAFTFAAVMLLRKA